MNYYTEIKNELINNEIYKKAKDYSKNKSDLNTYYNVGKLLIAAQGGEARAKYGNGLIKEYSKKLIKELDKKYNVTLLKRIRQFYLLIEKGATLSHQLSWSHYCEIIIIKNINAFNYYINLSLKYNLSVRELRNQIKNNEYERLDNNTKLKLINNEKENINDFIKNPIIIKNKYKNKNISEKLLMQLILEDIPSFMHELGDGYSYIDNEYKIKLGNNYNYIDLLLFNIRFNCYVVIELKITELRKEYIGQIEIYMNYIDENIKSFNHDKTIGIIICKENNEFIIKYTSDKRIISKGFVFN